MNQVRQIIVFLPRVLLSPVIGTRAARGNFPGISCTETQSRNQRRVGGWPGSFYTVRGDPTLRTNRRSATPPVNHTTFGRYFSPSQLPISPRTSRAQNAGRPKPSI